MDWNEEGMLYRTLSDKDGYTVRTDPLEVLVCCAMQGHEGDIEQMKIIMKNGVTYGPEAIKELAHLPDRPRK